MLQVRGYLAFFNHNQLWQWKIQHIYLLEDGAIWLRSRRIRKEYFLVRSRKEDELLCSVLSLDSGSKGGGRAVKFCLVLGVQNLKK